MGDAYPDARRAARLHHRPRAPRGGALPRDALEGPRRCSRSEWREREARGSAARCPATWCSSLYDTFGFPVDLTEDILAGERLGFDQAGFDAAMDEQRERARAAWKGSGEAAVGPVYSQLAARLRDDASSATTGSPPTRACWRWSRRARRCRRRAQGDAVEVVVEETPFYAESGGQVGDRGVIETPTGRDRGRGRAAARRRPHRPPRERGARRGARRPAGAARGRLDAPRSAPCATTRARTSSTRRCARCSASGAAQRGSLVTPGAPALRLQPRRAGLPRASSTRSRIS